MFPSKQIKLNNHAICREKVCVVCLGKSEYKLTPNLIGLFIDALRNGSEKDANFPLVALQHWADNIKFRAYCGRRDYMW